MLRATIGDVPALGFVFENPNSADVLVGETAPGTHDLVIYDGVQEVARAAKAVTIQAAAPARVRVVGTLFDLDEATARALRVGPIAGGNASQGEIVMLGDVQPGRRQFATGARRRRSGGARPVGAPRRPDPSMRSRSQWRRLRAGRNPVDRGHEASGPTGRSDVGRDVTGDRRAASDRSCTASRRACPLYGRPGGDRAAFMRAIAITLLTTARRPSPPSAAESDDRDTSTIDATLSLGVDQSRDGWRYRGHLALPGAPFTLTTDRYVANGSVIELTVEPERADR